MAGGACLLLIAGQNFNPYGPLPIKGFQFIANLAMPMLCFWVGMLIRHKVGKPKQWVIAIAGALMVASYCYSIYALSHFSSVNIFYQWWGIMLLGFILPWEYLYQHRDQEGIKSGIILLISALAFSTLDLVNERMTVVTLPAPVDDLGTLLSSVTLYVLPFAAIIPVYFAAEFSFSKAGQWLGEKKWFRWIIGIAAAYTFLKIIVDLVFVPVWDVQMWQLTLLFVQPFTIYLIIVICRIVCKLRKKEITWKEVFCI